MNNNLIKTKIYEIFEDKYEVKECGQYMRDKVTIFHKKCNNSFEFNSATDLCKDKYLKYYENGEFCPCCKNLTKESYMKRVEEFKNVTHNKITILDFEVRKSNEVSLLKCNVCSHEWETSLKTVINNSSKRQDSTSFGCPVCSNKRQKDTKSYSDELEKKFNGKIKLLSPYKNSKTPVIIMCNHCFKEKRLIPTSILKYNEDTICDCNDTHKSIGEIKIMNYLNSLNIPFMTEFAFPNLVLKAKLRFDFIIFIRNKFVVIEFDGEHHSKETSLYFDDECILRDNMKNDYCKENDIPLLRISYVDLKKNTMIKKLFLFLKENGIIQS